MSNKHDSQDTRPFHKPQASKVKKNDLMAITFFVKVKEVLSGSALLTTNLGAGAPEIKVDGVDLIESATSADQYQEEQTVKKTKAAEILVSSYHRPFTVSYVKEDGKERTLRGRLISHNILGRCLAEDMDIADSKDRLRQVDLRTINYLIVDGVKYTVDKK